LTSKGNGGLALALPLTRASLAWPLTLGLCLKDVVPDNYFHKILATAEIADHCVARTEIQSYPWPLGKAPFLYTILEPM